MTSNVKVTGGLRTEILSPTLMVCDGLTFMPPMVTRPFLHASVAMERVLNMRVAQSHLSILTSFIVDEKSNRCACVTCC